MREVWYSAGSHFVKNVKEEMKKEQKFGREVQSINSQVKM
jgi:hypothetical protein